jgi:hypothetical protein
MAFNQVLRLVLEQATDVFDELITPDTADNVINTLDKIENHALLKDNNCFIVTKHNGEIKIIASKNDQVKYTSKPMIINIQSVFDTLREKAESRKEVEQE